MLKFLNLILKNSGVRSCLGILILAFGIITPTGLAVEKEGNGWPRITLSNGLLDVVMPLSDRGKGYYRSHRFEAAGMIQSIRYKGHEFATEYKRGHRDPEYGGSAAGVAETFNSPISYGDGDVFLRLGRGVFRNPKDEKQTYHFHRNYELVQWFDWKITRQTKNSITFVQSVTTDYGWAYDYLKTVTLTTDKPELVVFHEMTNKGTKKLESDQYSHNYFLVNHLVPGPDYSLTFGYKPKLKATGFLYEKYTKPFLSTDGNEVVIIKPTGENQAMSPLSGYQNAVEASMKLMHKPSGASVTISVSDTPVKQELCILPEDWGICLENFIEVNLAPGERKTWTRVYRFDVNTVPKQSGGVK